MSGIYIKGMETPKACVFCELYDGEMYWCRGAKKEIPYSSEDERSDNCPLVPVPKHGRLIDADELIEFIENRYEITWEDDYEGGIKDACVDILEKISTMPTIIPAEEET